MIVVLAGIQGVATGFFRPAVYAGMPNLVDDEQLPSATSLLQTVENLTWMVGPVIGGVILSLRGPDLAYWVNAVTFVVSAALIARIAAVKLQTGHVESRGHWGDVADGFRVVLRSRALLTVLVVWNIVTLGVGAINVAEVALAKVSLDAGNLGFGILLGASGLGLTVGSFVSGHFVDKLGIGRVYFYGIALMAGGYAIAALASDDLRRRPGRRDRVVRQRRRRRLQRALHPARRAGRAARARVHRDHVLELRDARDRHDPRGRADRSLRRPLGLGWSGVDLPRRGVVHGRPGAARTRARGGARVSGRHAWTLDDLAGGVRSGDRRALARAISLVENRDPLSYELVRVLYPETGSAFVVGVTGPPGVGKSSLISALVRHVREAETTVGVISVDPSSPFTQGALLGDRIRLSDHFLDPGVFIRSMGTRGHLGGLSEATLQAALLLDAAGKELVLLETVGAGQSEVEVIGIADTVLLVLMPGSGDSVQALKAGIMEIPDVIAINKMDHPAAKTMLNEVRSILALDRDRAWRPPIVLTEAVRGENVPELWAKIEQHREFLESEGRLEERRRKNLAGEVFAAATSRAKTHLQATVAEKPELARLLDRVQSRELDPLSAVREILEEVYGIDDDDGTGTHTR